MVGFLSSNSGGDFRLALDKLLWVGQKKTSAHVAQLVEHVLGKDEVTGSIPVVSSSSASVS